MTQHDANMVWHMVTGSTVFDQWACILTWVLAAVLALPQSDNGAGLLDCFPGIFLELISGIVRFCCCLSKDALPTAVWVLRLLFNYFCSRAADKHMIVIYRTHLCIAPIGQSGECASFLLT